MVAGKRFDLEAVRAEAERQKRAAKTKAIVSNVVTVALLLAVAIGGYAGFKAWQANRAEKAAAAQAALEEEERERAERQRKEAEKREAERLKREAERKAEEERRHQEALAKEQAKIKLAELQAAEKAAEEESRRQAEENKVRQEHLKRFAENAVKALHLDASDYVNFSYGLEELVDVKIAEELWENLASAAAASRALDVLDLLRDASVTNAYSESSYPEEQVVDAILAKLDDVPFTMTLSLARCPAKPKLALAKVDPAEGLVFPDNAMTMRDARGNVSAWTVPFTHKDAGSFFLLPAKDLEQYARHWRRVASGIRKDAEKLDKKSRESFIELRLSKELPTFVNSVRAQIQIPPAAPAPAAEKEEAKPKPERKPWTGLRGGSGESRSLRGPGLRR